MPRVEIAIAVVERDGQFLIGQRPAGVALAGMWEFPGGKIKPGETPAQAAARECLEEAGLAVCVAGEYPQAEHDYAHADVRLHFLRCQVVEPAAVPREPFRWVARQQLADYEFPPANAKLIEQLLSS
ncbi:MAG: (deoxy)nucleoside triphosphate pyrophosphohydrolase [Planctomycetes bacterium]|nr:(deoxy)nucleoside triphosphate pyrophosphohydrolase [Planctomycetota bacterium]